MKYVIENASLITDADLRETEESWFTIGQRWGQLNAAFWLGLGAGRDRILTLEDVLGAVESGYEQALRQKAGLE